MKRFRLLIILALVPLGGCVTDSTVARDFRNFADVSGREYAGYVGRDESLSTQEKNTKLRLLNRMALNASKVLGEQWEPIAFDEPTTATITLEVIE